MSAAAAAAVAHDSGFHRKPVPGQRSYNDLQQHQQPQARPMHDNYSRPRAPSNSTTPSPVYGSRAPPPPNQQYHHAARVSNASSTMATSAAAAAAASGIQRIPTNASIPRRSTSSRSNSVGAAGTSSPTSYVALMRKQKATVWCDRAQHEDPRILAKHRADKMRAAMEVAGGRHHGNRVSTSSSNPGAGSGIRSKIRYPGATKAHAYLGGANMSGAGVPIRLSATEVDENDSEDEHDTRFGRRGGSGRSSTGSAARVSGAYVNSHLANDTTHVSAGHSPSGSMGYTPEEQTPVPTAANMNQSHYFEGSAADEVEAEQSFGGVGGLPPSKPKTEQDLKKEEELRRRGSVDDRAMTMSGQRLFVANPDLSD